MKLQMIRFLNSEEFTWALILYKILKIWIDILSINRQTLLISEKIISGWQEIVLRNYFEIILLFTCSQTNSNFCNTGLRHTVLGCITLSCRLTFFISVPFVIEYCYSLFLYIHYVKNVNILILSILRFWKVNSNTNKR